MKLNLGIGLGAMNGRASLNPLLTLPSLLSYVDFTDPGGYSFSSGVNVASIAAKAGSIGFSTIGTSRLAYDAALFSGKGGAKTAAIDADITYVSDSGAPAATTIGFVGALPSWSSGTFSVFSIGNTSAGDTSARLIHTAQGRLRYARDASNNFITVLDMGGPGVFLAILRYNSTSSLNVFANSLTPVTLDPNDIYASRNRTWIGDNGASTGESGVSYAEYFQTAQALSDQQIADVAHYWAGLYGITLS